jgi:hypothetical protein
MTVIAKTRRLRSFVRRLLPSVILALIFGFAACARAHGEIGVVLSESLDTSISRITGSGHSAVYLSRVCPASPVKLRLCRPGEAGSVISTYVNLGEDQPFEWNVVPLNIYLYGVEDSRYRPLFESHKIKHALEERYREKYLSAYCRSESCKSSNKAEWREMVGATLSRSMYIFVTDTTVDQDLQFIEKFNSLPNENHFNGVTRNCADFTRSIINSYFPHATNPDYINDFGITSPKAIARSFTHFALRQPEAHFRVAHFTQLPGTAKRSSECRAGTEQLYRSKKLLVPMLVFADYELAAAAASYMLTGRFDPEREAEQYPSEKATELEYQEKLAKSENDALRVHLLESLESQEREEVMGTPQGWKEYRERLASLIQTAIRDEWISRRDKPSQLFKRLETGTLSLDENGALRLELPSEEGISVVGLSASNVLARGFDPQLTFELLLDRVEDILHSPKHSRETMADFQKDWAMLLEAENPKGTRAPSGVSVARAGMPGTPIRSDVLLTGK